MYDALNRVKVSLQKGTFTPKGKLDGFPNLLEENHRNLVSLYLEYVGYFLLIRQFIETNGITFYEIESYPLEDRVITGLGK